MVDVLIVGGSVAGLSAALLLARCRRSILICDAGRPRNRFSLNMHGFLSREGISPKEFLRISREQIAEFPDVKFYAGTIAAIQRTQNGFSATAEDGSRFPARTVLLATGIVDELPNIPGLSELYGKSVHHCPYCDGWEHRDQPIAIYGKGNAGIELAREMVIWSADVIYCSDGGKVTAENRGKLEKLGIGIAESKIDGLVGIHGQLEKVKFANGTEISRRAMFFTGPQCQMSDLAQQLGCEFDNEKFVACDDGVKTCISGVYAAGNTSNGLQLAIAAAAEGAKAAHAINTELMDRQLDELDRNITKCSFTS